MKSLIKRLLNKEIISAYLYRGSGILLVFLLNIVLTRLYGKEIAGEYYILYNFLALLSAIGFLGFGYVIVHYVTPFYSELGDRSKGNLLLTISVYCTGLISVLIIALVFLFKNYFSVLLFHNGNYDKCIVFSSIILIPFLIVSLLSEIFKALKKPNESILATNIVVNFFFILFLLTLGDSDLEKIIFLFFIAYLVSIVLLFFKFYKLFQNTGIYLLTFKELKSSYLSNKFLCSEYISENFLLSVVSIANIVMGTCDSLIIAANLTAGDVALYTVANKVSGFGSIILTTVNSLIGFQIADLSFQNDQKELAKIFVKYTKIMIPLSLMYCIFAIAAAFLIPTIFGSDFTSSINLCIMLIVGQFIAIITGPCSYFAIMTGEAKKYMSITLQTAIISIITNIVFIYAWGIYGAVFSNIITLAYKNIYTFLFVKNKIHLQMREFI